jgi:hypothetical protein
VEPNNGEEVDRLFLPRGVSNDVLQVALSPALINSSTRTKCRKTGGHKGDIPVGSEGPLDVENILSKLEPIRTSKVPTELCEQGDETNILQ